MSATWATTPAWMETQRDLARTRANADRDRAVRAAVADTRAAIAAALRASDLDEWPGTLATHAQEAREHAARIAEGTRP